jgi:lipid A 3-O-deacylase
MLVVASRPAVGVGIGPEVGYGDHKAVAGVGIEWNLRTPIRVFKSWQLLPRLEAGLDVIHELTGGENKRTILAVGATPILRMQRPTRDLIPFVEFGAGLRLLSATTLDNKRYSSAFQFGELIGVGLQFGPRRAYEVAVRLEHISNGNIKKPNDGIGFGAIRFAYQWY